MLPPAHATADTPLFVACFDVLMTSLPMSAITIFIG